MESENDTRAPRELDRRTVLTGAAWSVPAISLMAASPAYATSTDRRVTLSLPGGATLPADGATPLQVTVTKTAGAAFAGAAVALTGPGSATFGAGSGTTDGSGRYDTTIDLNTPWATAGATVTLGAVSDGASATVVPTVLGANLFALGSGYGPAVTQAELVFPAPVAHALASSNFSAVLLTDGSVWTNGFNARGQLGDGSTTDRATWAVVPGLSDVVQISAGRDIVFARRGDGTVWGWGANDVGQMADGGSADALSPAPIAGLSNVTHVASGAVSGHALLADGTVRGWGSNSAGQMGTGTTSVASAVVTAGVSDVAQLAASNRTVIALLRDGTVRAWGQSERGQTGSGSTASTVATPAMVTGLSGVTAVAGGSESSAALLADGTVRMWGMNDRGQLGDGTAVDKSSPVAVTDLSSVSSLACAGTSTYARRTDGSVVAWGSNDDGRLGDGTTADRWKFVQIQGLSGHVISRLMVDNGQTSSAFFVVGRDELTLSTSQPILSAGADGVVTARLLAEGSPVVGRSVTFQATGGAALSAASGSTDAAGTVSATVSPDVWTVPGSTVAVSVASSSGSQRTSIAVLGSNVVGAGSSFGATVSQEERVFPLPVRQISSGDDFSVAVLADRSVWTKGENNHGQLGDGTTTSRSTWGPVPGLADVAAVSVGIRWVAARLTDGSVKVWGSGEYGTLGTGSMADVLSPTSISLTDVDHVIASVGNGYALKTDGTVWSWGDNHVGQLGDGTVDTAGTSPRLSPAQVQGLPGTVTKISASNWSVAALLSNGTVATWGQNNYGQVGDGSGVDRSLPVAISGLSGVVDVVSGRETTYVRLGDGTLRAWGMNEHGQTGNGTTTHALSPVDCGGLTGVTHIVPWGGSAFATLADGTIRSWGWNVFAQLSIGRTSEHELSPQTVIIPAGVKITGLGTPTPGNGTPFFFAEKDSASIGAVNLARGAEASASSVEGALVAANAVDGDTATRWGSDYSSAEPDPDDQWLAVDLGGHRSIGRVELVWNVAYAREYVIEVSSDGSAWNTVVSTQNGAGGTEVVTFATVAARHVRFRGIRRATSFGYSIVEFGIFAS